MTDLLASHIQQRFSGTISDLNILIAGDELTLEIPAKTLSLVCLALRDAPQFQFNQLIDVCGVDYLTYGTTEWQTEMTTETGFSRAVNSQDIENLTSWTKPRFAVVYHLLSLVHNHRIRLRIFVEDEPLVVDSVVDIWPAANWFEREVFDLFGIAFSGHPDLRRILTDYDFVGNPFRKDFPLIGHVEMRYDATLQRCIYEPVSIQPRILVPKVIRKDARYVRPGGVTNHV
jgi:NADH-quinone oxidoreductase subunit C